MRTERQYCVYIMANFQRTVLYTGVTNDLLRRVLEHKTFKGTGFTARYKCGSLVYYECGTDIDGAIFREKQIKGGSRKAKIALIEGINPEWRDLTEDIAGG